MSRRQLAAHGSLPHVPSVSADSVRTCCFVVPSARAEILVLQIQVKGATLARVA